MTNTTRRGSCTDCQLRPIDNSVSGPRLCTVCLRFADIEVMHFDCPDEEAHEYFGFKDATKCPYCTPALDPRYTIKTRKVNGPVAQTAHRSHRGCNHACTPADRAACRKAGGPKTA